MQKNEYVFITAVLAVALVFAGLALWRAAGAAEDATDLMPAAHGGGQVRDIDTGRIRRLLDAGTLSDHEALFYREHGGNERAP